MTAINANSFQTAETNDDFAAKNGGVLGTVEVTLQGKTNRVAAVRWEEGHITAGWRGGLTGRYQSGSKVWPATITLRGEKEDGHFGRDDNHPKFRKMAAIFFERRP